MLLKWDISGFHPNILEEEFASNCRNNDGGKKIRLYKKTSRIRLIKDKMAGSMMLTLYVSVCVKLVVLIGIGLVLKSLPILHDNPCGVT